MSETTTNILFGLVLVIFLILSIYMRNRRQAGSPLLSAVRILIDMNRNIKLVEDFSFHRRIKKFKTGAWEKNKDKLDFLPEELRQSLSQVFGMAEEINGRIESARKYQSDSYMAAIDVSKLKVPLAKSKEQLREWIQNNMNNPEYQPKRRGLFG